MPARMKHFMSYVYTVDEAPILLHICAGRALECESEICCSPTRAGEAEGEATDRAGWERYSADWRNYFQCMLAPVARQAAGLIPGPSASFAPNPAIPGIPLKCMLAPVARQAANLILGISLTCTQSSYFRQSHSVHAGAQCSAGCRADHRHVTHQQLSLPLQAN